MDILNTKKTYKINALSKKKTKEKEETLRTKNVRYFLQQLIHLSRFRQITIGVYVAVFLFRRHFCRNLSELSFFVSQSHARRRNKPSCFLSFPSLSLFQSLSYIYIGFWDTRKKCIFKLSRLY